MKATNLLQRQHRILEDLLEKLTKPRTNKPPLLKDLAEQFAAHSSSKLQLFYPAVKELNPQWVEDGCQDLLIAGELVGQLLACDPDDARFHDAVITVKELVEQRIDRDETGLFLEAERRIDPAQLSQLGGLMEARLAIISSRDEIPGVRALKKRAA